MKKFLRTLIIAVALASLCLTLFACTKNKGDPDAELPFDRAPIEISTAQDLASLNSYVGKRYAKYRFKLTSDIDLSSTDVWVPIGETSDKAFYGELDGNGRTVANLKIKGVGENGAPIYIAADKGGSFASVGLFGYVSHASIKNLTLSNVQIECYTDGKNAFAGGLVGFDAGNSTFENITVSGEIALANIYKIVKTVNEDGSEGFNEVCTLTQYMAAVAAYSAGGSKFLNVAVDGFNLLNDTYRAAMTEEGYRAEINVNLGYIPETAFAGLVCAYAKNAEVKNVSVSGKAAVLAESSSVGGAFCQVFGGNIKNLSEEKVTCVAYAYKKVTAGGFLALLDDGILEDSESENVEIFVYDMGSLAVQATIGGGAGYLNFNSVMRNVALKNARLYTNSYNGYRESTTGGSVGVINCNAGGIVGVINDSALKNSTLEDGAIIIERTSSMTYENIFEASDDAIFNGNAVFTGASIFFIAFGNSDISNCTAAVQNMSKDGTSYNKPNARLYFPKVVVDVHVNKDGKEVVKLANKDKLSEFIFAYAELKDGTLNVTVYSEEFNEILQYSVAVDTIIGTKSDTFKYIDSYFSEGTGLKNASGKVSIDGRDLAKYVRRDGIPKFNGVPMAAV